MRKLLWFGASLALSIAVYALLWVLLGGLLWIFGKSGIIGNMLATFAILLMYSAVGLIILMTFGFFVVFMIKKRAPKEKS